MFDFIWGGGAISFPALGLEIDPPRGFTLFGKLDIRFYGVIIALGLVLAVVYGMRRSKEFGFKSDDILDGVLWIAPVSIICARIYYVVSEWDRFQDNPISALYIWEGGLAVYGSVIGAALCVILFCKRKKVSLPALLDLVAISFLIGQFIGRWGNFMNREAYGCYTDSFLAMRVADSLPDMNTLLSDSKVSQSFIAQVEQLRQAAIDGGYAGFIQVHPTFLYESLWNVVGFVALHFLSKKRQYDGQMALGYAAWYGLGRAWIEGLRMDSLYLFPNWLGETVRVSQLLAIVSCVASVTVLVIMAFRKHDKQKLFVNRVKALEAEEGISDAETNEDEQD